MIQTSAIKLFDYKMIICVITQGNGKQTHNVRMKRNI